MAEKSLYLDSLKYLSVALEKGVALSSVRTQIKSAYSIIPSGPGIDPQIMMDALLEALPNISKLQNDENELKRDYVEAINKTINTIIDYIVSIESDDLNNSFITSLQKYLQVLIDIVSSSSIYLNDASLGIDAKRAQEAMKKISAFGGIPQADNIIEKVKKLFSLIRLSYVG